MDFFWLRNRRRRKILSQPFPEDWWVILLAQVAQVRHLSPQEKVQLHACVKRFVSENRWVGCNGLEMDDTIRLPPGGTDAVGAPRGR